MPNEEIESFIGSKTTVAGIFAAAILPACRKRLGLTQRQMAKLIGVTQSTIARVEQGEVNPSNPYPYILNYHVEPKQGQKWLELLYGVPPTFTFMPGELEYVDFQIDVIRSERTAGRPRRAIEFADRLDQMLKEKEQYASGTVYEQIHQRRGKVLLEKANTYRDFLTGDEILHATRPILKDVQDIARSCGNAELFGMAEHQFGSIYYIAQDHHAATRHYEKSLQTIKLAEEKLAVLSGLAYAWAQHGPHAQKQYQEAAVKFTRLLDETEFSDLPIVCDALQTLARAQGLMNREQGAWDTLAQLQTYCLLKDQRGRPAPIRDVQLYKAQVEIIVRFEPQNAGLEQIGIKGRSLAQQYGFYRHAEQIQQLLEEALG